MRKRNIFLSLICFLVLIPLISVSNIHALEKQLSEPEVSDLSIKAFAKDKESLDKLIREYRRYEQRLKKEAILPDAEYDLYNEIITTLELLAPQALPASPPKKRVFVKEPGRKLMVQPDKVITERYLYGESTSYFNFNEGTTLILSGAQMSILSDAWVENGKILKMHVLSARKKKETLIETQTMNEIYSTKDGWLAEQTFFTYTLTPAGVQMQRDVVLNQPTPGTIAVVGKQLPFSLARFPLKAGSMIEGYRVKNLSSTVKTGAGEFSNCLLISNQTEELAFAPNVGLISMTIFDEKWLLKEILRSSPSSLPDIPGKNRKIILKKIKQFCGKNRVRLAGVLSLKSGGELQAGRALSRLLVYETDAGDPDQKRFKIIEQEWAKKADGSKIDWELQTEK